MPSEAASSASLPLAHMHDYGVTVSFSGAFSPPLLQPARLNSLGVLSADEAENHKDLYVRSEFSRFSTDHLTLEANLEVIEITTRDQGSEQRLAELAERLLEALPSCPIRELSIARYAHFALDANQRPVDVVTSAFDRVDASIDADLTHATSVRRFVARSWQGLVLPTMWSGLLQAPRLDELTMRGDRTDGRNGNVLVTIEPSLIVPGGAFIAQIDVIEPTIASRPHGDRRQDSDLPAPQVAAELRGAWSPTRKAAFNTFVAIVEALAQSGSGVQHG